MENEDEDLLMIFTRNPELGKCKTRLAASVGDETALEIYTFLLEHTVKVTVPLKVNKRVYYSEKIGVDDLWQKEKFQKKLQQGKGLGERMAKAFKNGFEDGFKRIVIIGSDLFDLSTDEVSMAFEKLHTHDYVLGPARDGGYYLLGMTRFDPELFTGKSWGTNTVLQDTLSDLENENYFLLALKNDVDVLEDILDVPEFQPFLKNKI